MPLSSAVRERVRAFLSPDDQIQYVLPASSPSTAFVAAHFIIVVTDASIIVLYTGFGSRIRPKSVLARYRRDTRLGPVDTASTPTFKLGSMFFEIDDEYVSVVNAADAEILSPDPMPPDPLPDL